MVLSCGFGDDGVYIDCVDHVVEVLSLIRGEWLPVLGSVYGTVEGDSPQGPDEPDNSTGM